MRYWKVKKNTKLDSWLRDYWQTMRDIADQRQKLAEEMLGKRRAVGFVFSRESLTGFCYKKPRPDDQVPDPRLKESKQLTADGDVFYVPNRRAKGGRPLLDRMNQLRLPTLGASYKLFNFQEMQVINGQLTMMRPGFKYVESIDQFIITTQDMYDGASCLTRISDLEFEKLTADD